MHHCLMYNYLDDALVLVKRKFNDKHVSYFLYLVMIYIKWDLFSEKEPNTCFSRISIFVIF